jgi:heterogeneous nuclear ribonucleoprotein L
MKRAFTQALVEFEDVQTGIEAKKALNGADIYPGCCTLKVEYAKVRFLG